MGESLTHINMDAHCQDLTKIDYTNFVVSLILFFGILVSYLPQHIRIIRRRSSFGLSPYFVLLGTTSGTCAFANILVLPASRADVACCQDIDGLPCFASLLGIAQVGMQWSCFCIILMLFLIYFPRATPSSLNPAKDPNAPSYRTALAVTAICILHALVILILSFCFTYAAPEYLQQWANFLGIFSTVLASIQYFPQIYTTFMLKRVGSLSIPMMCLQTPGSFLWAASLAARLGSSGWSAWGVYIVTGCLQGTLLVMGSYFEIMHRRRERQSITDRIPEGNGNAVPSNEETPLLRGDD